MSFGYYILLNLLFAGLGLNFRFSMKVEFLEKILEIKTTQKGEKFCIEGLSLAYKGEFIVKKYRFLFVCPL